MTIAKQFVRLMKNINKVPDRNSQCALLTMLATHIASEFASRKDLAGEFEKRLSFFELPEDLEDLLILGFYCLVQFEELSTNQD